MERLKILIVEDESRMYANQFVYGFDTDEDLPDKTD